MGPGEDDKKNSQSLEIRVFFLHFRLVLFSWWPQGNGAGMRGAPVEVFLSGVLWGNGIDWQSGLLTGHLCMGKGLRL